MNKIDAGFDLTERWRLHINANWGDDGQNGFGVRVIERHDWNEEDA